MRVLVAAARAQFQMTVRNLGSDLFNLVTVPFFAVVFIAIVKQSGRSGLIAYAVMAPVLIALWQMAIYVAGELINRDRLEGLLEAIIATPAPFALVMLGRIGTINAFGLVGFAESWLVARIVFCITVPVPHPEVLLPTLACAAFACAGTALVFSALFSLQESARVFQNSISYPFYLLGGILVPVSYLPWWLQPASRVIFLSWTADLLRDSLLPAPPVAVPQRLAIVLLLAFAGLLVGWFLLHRIVDRLRHEGTLGLA